MIEIRKSEERGRANHGWLDTYHSFSFANYYDPENVQFGPLRVLNEDFIKPHTGFDTHPHDNMEIVTYVLSGAVSHKDSTGGEGVIKSGEIQTMSAGTGILHSEKNDGDEELHLLQIWFMPAERDITPGYNQHLLDADEKNILFPVASNIADLGVGNINQDVVVYIGEFDKPSEVKTNISEGRIGYLHNTLLGEISLNGQKLNPGDGAKITGPEELFIKAKPGVKLILFDMAGTQK